MKSNELQSPVDQYFRQQEAEIPVIYNPEHWSQLAELLDASKPDKVPELTAQPQAQHHPRNHRGKAWWVSGIWMLLLTLVSSTFWQNTSRDLTKNYGLSISPMPKTPMEIHPEAWNVLPKIELVNNGKSQSQSIPFYAVERAAHTTPFPEPGKMVEYASEPRDSVETGAEGIADSLLKRPMVTLPRDSISVSPKAVKKKKYLFW